MNHFKPGDRCIIIKSDHPQNVGRIVTVVRYCSESGTKSGHIFHLKETGVRYHKGHSKPAYVITSDRPLQTKYSGAMILCLLFMIELLN